MKKYFICSAIFLLGFCISLTTQAEVPAPVVIAKHSKAFEKISSCTPTLQWEALQDPKISYEVMVYKALDKKGGLNDRGEKVFQQEKITTTSVEVNPPLEAKSKYLWSVRAKNSKAEFSPWATHQYFNKNILSPGTVYGVWYGIETPACPQSSSPNHASTNPPKTKTYKGSYLKDDYIAELLKAGNGGLVLDNSTYLITKPDKSEDPNHKATLEELVAAGKVKAIDNRGLRFLVIAPGEEKEISIEQNWKSLILLLGSPGEYTITRLLTSVEGPYQSNQNSIRIYQKVKIEAGKLSYLGSIQSLQLKGYLVLKTSYGFKPEDFKAKFEELYPQSSAFLQMGPVLSFKND